MIERKIGHEFNFFTGLSFIGVLYTYIMSERCQKDVLTSLALYNYECFKQTINICL